MSGAEETIDRAISRKFRSELGERTSCHGREAPGPISQESWGARRSTLWSSSARRSEFSGSEAMDRAFARSHSQKAWTCRSSITLFRLHFPWQVCFPMRPSASQFLSLGDRDASDKLELNLIEHQRHPAGDQIAGGFARFGFDHFDGGRRVAGAEDEAFGLEVGVADDQAP